MRNVLSQMRDIIQNTYTIISLNCIIRLLYLNDAYTINKKYNLRILTALGYVDCLADFNKCITLKDKCLLKNINTECLNIVSRR